MAEQPINRPSVLAAQNLPLEPFEVLFDGASGDLIPLPPRLAEVVGPIRLAARGAQPYVVANFVATLDGVVAFNGGGKNGGAEISLGDAHDRLLMAVLRAVAEVIVIGNGTLRGSPRHKWLPESVAPEFASEFRELREALGLPARPLVAVVSASGQVDLDLPLFADVSIPSMIITSDSGAAVLNQGPPDKRVEIVALGNQAGLDGRHIIDAITQQRPGAVVLTEGGPRLLAALFADRAIDELFLTIAPQVAGRDQSVFRPALVEGRVFAPAAPLWSRILGIRRSQDFLYLRYGFDRS